VTQQYPQQPSGQPVPPNYQPQPENPGKGLAIGGLICGIILGPLAFIGLIMSIVALRKSKAAGMSNGIAVAGIVVSILVFIAAVVTIAVIAVGAAALLSMCADLGQGVHQVNGVTVTCG
jgi:predicted lipid-binding transport protein (Tim44 family)